MSNYNKSLFEGVPKKNPNKSKFNRSHEWKAQMLPGYLIPCLVEETLPGDNYDLNAEFMFRFSPLYFPIMHKMTMRADWFFVPNRILWQNTGDGGQAGWVKWISELQEATPPYFTGNLTKSDVSFNNHLLCYMGLPLIDVVDGSYSGLVEELNAFPISAYIKIWDEYYRVPQLEDEKWSNLQDGDMTTVFDAVLATAPGGVYLPFSAKWEKDYFTSALPTPQIGDAIQIPLVQDTDGDGIFYDNNPTTWRKLSDGTIMTGTHLLGTVGSPGDGHTEANAEPLGLDIQDTAGTIRQLRLAEVLQSYYERIMKVGQRYRDFIKGLWGVDPQPMTIDRPVLIGSKFGRVQIADVMTQAYTAVGETGSIRTGDYTGQANLYSSDNDQMNYYCHEHGWILCILQLNPNTSYGNGIERFWRRSVPTDYALDMFASIGDQEIAKEEVLYNPIIADEEKNFETFGYIPRFSEYRYKNNMHVGILSYDAGLSQHLGRIWDLAGYDNDIEIDSVFTSSAPDLVGGIRITDTFRTLPSGVTQFPSEGLIYAHVFHTIWVDRALPMFSTPKL